MIEVKGSEVMKASEMQRKVQSGEDPSNAADVSEQTDDMRDETGSEA